MRRKILIILAMAAIVLVPICVWAQESSFFEDFSDGRADNWTDDGSGRWSVTSGVYQMDSKEKVKESAISYFAKARYGNCDYEAKVRKTYGSKRWYSGLMFKSRGAERYLFLISVDGKYCLWKNSSDGSGSYLVSWTYSYRINAGLSNWNTLRVVVDGSLMKLYINGYHMKDVYDDHFISGGYIGLMSLDKTGREICQYDDVKFTGFPVMPTLTVSTYPASSGKVTGEGIDCGSDCQEIYLKNTEVTLTASTYSGWKFLNWDDGGLCYAANSITVKMTDDKNVKAVFTLDDSIVSLSRTDKSPLGTRTPLVLIHGNNNEKGSKYYSWGKFIKLAQGDAEFKSKYKIYLFRWNSKRTDLFNGRVLGYLLDSKYGLAGKTPVFLAHSRGGNVARSHMNYYVIDAGKFKGKLGGDRVKYLVTLATPHRGSPGADPILVTFSIDNKYKDNKVFAELLSRAYYDFNTWKSESHPFLVIDDWENKFTNDDVCWDSSLMGDGYCAKLFQNQSLLKLNKKEKYLGKIIAFGGNNFDRESVVKIIKDPRVVTSLHRQADLGAALMATIPIIPNGHYLGMPLSSNRPFEANDGAVPLSSALFLKSGSLGVFTVDASGKLVYSSEAMKKYLQTKESIILEGNIDHQDFLDKSTVLSQIIKKLKELK